MPRRRPLLQRRQARQELLRRIVKTAQLVAELQQLDLNHLGVLVWSR